MHGVYGSRNARTRIIDATYARWSSVSGLHRRSGAHSANGWPVVERAPEQRGEGAGGTRVHQSRRNR
ncbi:hypothetical protein AB0G29_20210 [Streptomyces parvus]|uniref:hypothetical protein n=1 Tax=Streptomyces parvus TaxID=66428 RepID=UPI0033EFF4BE